MSWNRLTNGEREELCKLPVWTTPADRRRALSYVDQPLKGALEAIKAVSSGEPAPTNLGVLVAAARYEDAGWMPDGCFEKWRRWRLHGHEQLDVESLIQWLDTLENTIGQKMRNLEIHLTEQCCQQEGNLTTAQSGALLAQQRLHAHQQKQILARLSLSDIAGAQQIAQRMPAGSARDAIDKLFRELQTVDKNPEQESPAQSAAPTHARAAQIVRDSLEIVQLGVTQQQLAVITERITSQLFATNAERGTCTTGRDAQRK